jgi:hypothetical protein
MILKIVFLNGQSYWMMSLWLDYPKNLEGLTLSAHILLVLAKMPICNIFKLASYIETSPYWFKYINLSLIMNMSLNIFKFHFFLCCNFCFHNLKTITYGILCVRIWNFQCHMQTIMWISFGKKIEKNQTNW